MNRKQVVVGISGGSGSGKTSILYSLRDIFSESELCIVSQDNYYLPKQKQKIDTNGITNFDLPSGVDSNLLLKHIKQLKSRKTVNHVEYTFNNDKKQSNKIVLKPADIIVIEGLFIFHFEQIFKELDISVFVQADDNTRLQRRIARDAGERGYPKDDVIYQWENHVKPSYKDFLKPYINKCNLVINNDVDYHQGLNDMLNLIKEVSTKK